MEFTVIAASGIAEAAWMLAMMLMGAVCSSSASFRFSPLYWARENLQ
ncbi:MAG: hypothetical protein R3C20_20870 [Planctomycetaceae bacterium]